MGPPYQAACGGEGFEQSVPVQNLAEVCELQGTLFPQYMQELESFWRCQAEPDDDQPRVPVFLDLLSGPRCPLTQAFQWAGWKVLQPIDIAIDPACDVTDVSVQRAIGEVLPTVHLSAAAIDCSTKSRIRAIPVPGAKRAPKPLRSQTFPRGLPNVRGAQAARVHADNACSDFLLATQHVLHEHGRGAFRENPGNSLHWFDPVEQKLQASGQWHDFQYFACVFLDLCAAQVPGYPPQPG